MPRSASTSLTANETILKAATGRWGEVAAEVKAVEPYEITTDLTIPPITRSRRRKLKAAQTAYMMTAAKLAELLRELDGKEASEADQATVVRIQQLAEQSERTYDEALFGDHVDDVYKHFDDMPDEFWDAFYNDFHDRMVHRIAPPEDICSKCGQELPGQETDSEGKAQGESSSTSSTDTGTPSKETSATTSA